VRGKVCVFTDFYAAAVDNILLSRHFANGELKVFMVLLLMRYTLEIDPKSSERPTFMLERMGAGVMHPRGDLQIILRARE